MQHSETDAIDRAIISTPGERSRLARGASNAVQLAATDGRKGGDGCRNGGGSSEGGAGGTGDAGGKPLVGQGK